MVCPGDDDEVRLSAAKYRNQLNDGPEADSASSMQSLNLLSSKGTCSITKRIKFLVQRNSPSDFRQGMVCRFFDPRAGVWSSKGMFMVGILLKPNKNKDGARLQAICSTDHCA